MGGPMMGGPMMGGDPYGGDGMMGGHMGGHDPFGGGMMGGGDFFGGGGMMGGGDFFGGSGMGGDDFFGGPDDSFGMDFFYNDPYSTDPHAHHYDHVPDVVVSSGAAVAHSSGGVSTMILADGGNTVSINSSQLITNGTLLGGSGNDVITMSGSGAIGVINLGAGTDSITLAGNNVLSISNTETVTTSIGTDVLNFTGGGTTSILASSGSDSISLSNTNTETIKYAATNALGDNIMGFSSGTDKLQFSRSAFNGDNVNNNGILDYGVESGAGLVQSSTNKHFVFNQTSKQLYYDADANGAGAGVVVANLDTTIADGDIIFVA